MREITAYIFMGSIYIMTIAVGFVLYKIQQFSKLNLSPENYRYTKECEDKLDKKQKEIESIFSKVKLFYLIFIVTIIDTTFIYEPSLLKAFNNNQTLICSFKDKDIKVNNKTFKYTQTNRFFNSGIVTKIDDKNISIDLDMCNIKNKSWWE